MKATNPADMHCQNKELYEACHGKGTYPTGEGKAPRWDNPIYWQGVRVGQCQKCKRKEKAVTRHGLCWLCEQPNSISWRHIL